MKNVLAVIAVIGIGAICFKLYKDSKAKAPKLVTDNQE